MTIRIEDSLELLSQEEWNKYFSVTLFDEMKIDESSFGISPDVFQNIDKPLLHELIMLHNNKVGNLHITYALCMHYFDKGIPDDPWYISPGKNGTSIQYYPEFEEKHYMRLFWFGYFADAYYLRIQAIWDSIVEILNHYYGLDYEADLRLRSKVLKWLKDNKSEISNEFQAIMNEAIYKEAQEYRTKAAHGTSPSMIQNIMKIEKNVETEVPDIDKNGRVKVDENGCVVYKKIIATKRISLTAGDYTSVTTLKANMENYALFTGQKIKKIIKLMTT